MLIGVVHRILGRIIESCVDMKQSHRYITNLSEEQKTWEYLNIFLGIVSNSSGSQENPTETIKQDDRSEQQCRREPSGFETSVLK
jgi:hypothetical protein